MRLTNVSVVLSLTLTACGNYNEQFDCPIGKGLKCASLSEVNQRLDDGHLPLGFPPSKSGEAAPKIYWQADLTAASPKGL